MSPPNRTWKSTELRVCRAWGGRRHGPSFGKQCSDCDGAAVSLEVTRTTRPAQTWKVKWKQCVRNAEIDGKPAVLVVAEPRQRVDQMVAVVSHGWLLDVCRKAGVIG